MSDCYMERVPAYSHINPIVISGKLSGNQLCTSDPMNKLTNKPMNESTRELSYLLSNCQVAHDDLNYYRLARYILILMGHTISNLMGDSTSGLTNEPKN